LCARSSTRILPNAEHYDYEDEFPGPIVEQMKELRLFGVTIPEEFGGMGLDLTTYAMIAEELSRGWISISGVINTHFIGSYLLMKFGTDEQKQKYLLRIAIGAIRAALLSVRSDAWASCSGEISSVATGCRGRRRTRALGSVGWRDAPCSRQTWWQMTLRPMRPIGDVGWLRKAIWTIPQAANTRWRG
jgi:hypothetical protein